MKNQLQSVNLIVQFDSGLCLEIRNIYVEDTNDSIALDELKKTGNLFQILSFIEK